MQATLQIQMCIIFNYICTHVDENRIRNRERILKIVAITILRDFKYIDFDCCITISSTHTYFRSVHLSVKSFSHFHVFVGACFKMYVCVLEIVSKYTYNTYKCVKIF